MAPTASLPGLPRWVGHITLGRPGPGGPHHVIVPVQVTVHPRRLRLWALLHPRKALRMATRA